jgi:hypothetical protein
MPKLSSKTSHALGAQNARRQEAMSGDLVFTASPATLGTVNTVADAGTTRTVQVALKNAAGNVHEWFNKAITTGVAVSDTTTPEPTILSTTLTFVNGLASVVITYPTGAYDAGETVTLTVAAATILGETVASVTSVDTLV